MRSDIVFGLLQYFLFFRFVFWKSLIASSDEHTTALRNLYRAAASLTVSDLHK